MAHRIARLRRRSAALRMRRDRCSLMVARATRCAPSPTRFSGTATVVVAAAGSSCAALRHSLPCVTPRCATLAGDARFGGTYMHVQVATASGCFADVFARLFTAFACSGEAADDEGGGTGTARERRISSVGVFQAMVASGVVPHVLDSRGVMDVIAEVSWSIVAAREDAARAEPACSGMCQAELVEAFVRAVVAAPAGRVAGLLMGAGAGCPDAATGDAFLRARGVSTRAQRVHAVLRAALDAGGTGVGLPPRSPAPVAAAALGAHFVAAAATASAGAPSYTAAGAAAGRDGDTFLEPTWSVSQLRGFCERFGVIGGGLSSAHLSVLIADTAAASTAPPGRLDAADFSSLVSRAAAARFAFAPVPDEEMRRVIAAHGLGEGGAEGKGAAAGGDVIGAAAALPAWAGGDAGMCVPTCVRGLLLLRGVTNACAGM